MGWDGQRQPSPIVFVARRAVNPRAAGDYSQAASFALGWGVGRRKGTSSQSPDDSSRTIAQTATAIPTLTATRSVVNSGAAPARNEAVYSRVPKSNGTV